MSISEYHEYLMHAKITGSLTEAEQQEFENLINENTELKQSFKELQSKYSSEDLGNSLARFKHPGKWRDLPAEFEKREAQKNSFRIRLLAAAVTIGLIVAGWWAWKVESIDKNVIASVNKEKVLLRLNDGQLIDLSTSKGNISTSSAILNNADQTLSYSNKGAPVSGLNKLTVPVGMDYKLVLSDSSVVWLNAATDIEFPFNFEGRTREIKINGEAYLEIVKNANKPFIVRLPGSSVTVLGTEFNVNTYDTASVKVSLVNGSVKMASSKNEVMLTPGNEAVLNANDKIVTQVFNKRHTLSWREGLFYFQRSTLEEIIRVLPRWYGIAAVIDDPAVSSRRFTGVIDKKEPIQVFMADIKGMSGVESYFDKDGVLHFH